MKWEKAREEFVTYASEKCSVLVEFQQQHDSVLLSQSAYGTAVLTLLAGPHTIKVERDEMTQVETEMWAEAAGRILEEFGVCLEMLRLERTEHHRELPVPEPPQPASDEERQRVWNHIDKNLSVSDALRQMGIESQRGAFLYGACARYGLELKLFSNMAGHVYGEQSTLRDVRSAVWEMYRTDLSMVERESISTHPTPRLEIHPSFFTRDRGE